MCLYPADVVAQRSNAFKRVKGNAGTQESLSGSGSGSESEVEEDSRSGSGAPGLEADEIDLTSEDSPPPSMCLLSARCEPVNPLTRAH